MTMTPCDWCKKSGHAWFQCPDPKRPVGWKPDRLKKSAVPSTIPRNTEAADRGGDGVQSTVAAQPLTKLGTPRKRAPKGTFDRKAYQREAARLRRQRLKEAKA